MILFLDIDGVLMGYTGSRIRPEAIAALHSAHNKGDLLILHSTWRKDMLPEAQQLFKDVGLELDGWCDPKIASKREAIIAWLDEMFGGEWPTHITVVDDHDIEPIPGVRIVKIDPKVGLRKEDLR